MHPRTLVSRLLDWGERSTRTDVRYVTKGGAWLLTGQAVAILVSFAVAIAFGHWAAQDLYGNYKYALSLASLLGALSLTGISTALIRSVAQGKDGALRDAFWLSIRWSYGIVLVGIATSIFYYIQGNVFVSATLLLASLVMPIINACALYDPYLVGRKEFRRNTIFASLQLVVTSALLVAALALGSSRAIVFVCLYFLCTLAFVAFFYLITRKRVRNQQSDPDLFRYSSHVSVINLINAVADRIDSIVIFSLLGPSQLAVYLYAIAMPEQMKNALKIIVPLSMPRFAQREISDIRTNLYWRLTLATIAVAAAVLLYLFAVPYIFQYLFPIYIESIHFSRLYAISILFAAIPPTIISVIQAHQKTKALHIVSNSSAFFLLALLPVGTYFWGIEGAMLSHIASRFAHTGVALWQFATLRD